MNSLINYIIGRRLARLNRGIEKIQGELTYYQTLREEGLSNEIPEEREGKLIIKLNDFYDSYFSISKLNKQICLTQ